MTVDDFGNFLAMFPNHFPALAHVGNMSGRTEIGPQNFVANEDETDFAHKSPVPQHTISEAA